MSMPHDSLTCRRSVWLHAGQNVQTGQDSPPRIVLMSDRHTKKGQDRIAHQPRDRVFVLVHRPDHMLKCAINCCRPIFRIYLLGRGRGALDVKEKNGHDPALAAHLGSYPDGFKLGRQLARQKSVDWVPGRFRCLRRSLALVMNFWEVWSGLS
jgi:hypothetical protein